MERKRTKEVLKRGAKRLTALLAAAALTACTNMGGGQAKQFPVPAEVTTSASPTPDVNKNAKLAPHERMVFTSDREGSHDIYLLTKDKLTQLTSGEATDWNPQVSPDGKSLVFCSDRANGTFQIYSLEIDNPQNITRLTNSESSDFDPTYMYDGRILFKSNTDGYGDIWIMDGDGQNTRNLTESMGTTEEWDPVAIDDTRIVFTSRQQQGKPASDELYMVDISTGDITRLTNNDLPDWFPNVSPDGTKLTYISKDSPDDPDGIFVSDIGVQYRKRVSNHGILPGDWDDPSWAPDGSLVFLNNDGEKGSRYAIYRINEDGSNIRLLDESPDGKDGDLAPVIFAA